MLMNTNLHSRLQQMQSSSVWFLQIVLTLRSSQAIRALLRRSAQISRV